MREIKFRAFYTTDNQMIDWSTLTQSAWNTFRGETPLSLIYEILVARKDDFHVMQFTGLKDKNGKNIYEGDIIDCDMSYNGGSLPHRGVLIYHSRFGAFATKNDGGETLLHNHILSSLEIIGNIHQNKDLLK